jgi:hypothetical protein
MRDKIYKTKSRTFFKNIFSKKEISNEEESQEFLIEKAESLSESNEESPVSNENIVLNNNIPKNNFIYIFKTFDGYIYALLFTLFRSLSNIFIKMSSSLIGSEHSTIR